ncbi:hypothetical protein [Herbidospora cretacea]|uniref:hypothetical protein n=1 Tax=Herbidospora cretacea TaxID=28444 RepID=UPI0012DC8A68|nr:hypothetical protein [Herbidospora cretacea]
MPEVSVRLVSPGGGSFKWVLDYGGEAHDYFVHLTAPEGASWEAQGADLFSSLQDIRRQIEPRGWRICVNGARLDAYPSRLSLDTSGGHWIYIVRRWWPARRVYIFDAAPVGKIASVAEQDEYFEKWSKWVKRGRGFDPAP